MLVGDILLRNSQWYPDKVGIIDQHTRFTWREMNSRVNRLANALLGLGLRKGDRAAIVCENRHEIGEFVFAVAKSGVIGTGINYRLVPEQIARQINTCQPKVVLVQDKFAAKVNSVRPELEGVQIFIGIGEGHGYSYDYEHLMGEYPSQEPKVNVREDDVHMIIYTSGTTGWIKGAMHTHGNRIAHCAQAYLALRFSPVDIYLNPGPAFAFGGQSFFIASCFAGATTILQTWRSPEEWLTIQKEKVTVASMVPVRWRFIREYLASSEQAYDLSSLQRLPTSTYFPPEQLREIPKLLGVPEISMSKMYAGTEFGICATLSYEDVAAALSSRASEREIRRLSAIGRPILCNTKIVDESGKDVPPGDVGELLIQGENVMKGYWNLAELNEEVLTGGWYHTKDLVWQDEDGYLYFSARKDQMIKTGGFNVYPEEVETVISNHPAVAEVAVFGVQDEKWGLAVTAAVVLEKGKSATEEEIRTHCRQFLSGFQVPKKVHFLDRLPTTEAQQRVAKMELRRIFSRGQY